MTSAWGNSWGSAWADTWVAGEDVVVGIAGPPMPWQGGGRPARPKRQRPRGYQEQPAQQPDAPEREPVQQPAAARITGGPVRLRGILRGVTVAVPATARMPAPARLPPPRLHPGPTATGAAVALMPGPVAAPVLAQAAENLAEARLEEILVVDGVDAYLAAERTRWALAPLLRQSQRRPASTLLLEAGFSGRLKDSAGRAHLTHAP